MKIYKLTIGIDEKNEQVEFIQEEQYDVKDTPKVAIPEELDPNIGVQEEDFDISEYFNHNKVDFIEVRDTRGPQ